MKKSNTAGDTVRSKREGFPSMQIDEEDYLRMKINSETHIALGWENQVLLNGIWQISPTPKGFSGEQLLKLMEYRCGKTPLITQNNYLQEL